MIEARLWSLKVMYVQEGNGGTVEGDLYLTAETVKQALGKVQEHFGKSVARVISIEDSGGIWVDSDVRGLE
jgi:hypothetical protein